MKLINKIYRDFLKFYGSQGWWPIFDSETIKNKYHVNAPKNENESFEIVIGAILTQNVAWKNVEKAICNLKVNNYFSIEGLSTIPVGELAEYIRPSGYYNQKAKKIKNFLQWFSLYSFSFKKFMMDDVSKMRDELLSINGIGPETADSILLYGLSQKVFVVDAYTRRIFARNGILSGSESYDEIQKIFHDNFNGDINFYNEYHALIVAHGKDYCKKKPLCEKCCITDYCIKNI